MEYGEEIELHECFDCGKWFEYSYDETYTSSDIIEGQYTEFTTVKCPHCWVENRW